ncbi:MAG TPA: pyridoxine 5'-phosphate synthase, partial [Saprospiraceae bacterium]|nr:pyridoxine 5'-phosphate synthase [Saprospiraceae bacterium]
RSSIFINADEKMVEGAKALGADRVELYTGPFAAQFPQDPEAAVAPHRRCARIAAEIGIGLNAGHDLNLDNLRFYQQHTEALL